MNLEIVLTRFLNNVSFSLLWTLLALLDRDSFKGHSAKREDNCITCGASNHPTSTIVNPGSPS